MILVFGNINSGKSYCIDKIKEIFPKYQVIKIDDYRIKYGDGTIEKDNYAMKQFTRDIIFTKDCIVECTGLGLVAENLRNSLKDTYFVILKIEEKLNICLERLKNKSFENIPYPKFEENIKESIIRIDKEIRNKAIENIWSSEAVAILTIESNIKKTSLRDLLEPFQKIKLCNN